VEEKTRKQTLANTRERRKTQTCKTFELKITSNKLNKKDKEYFKMLFVEAKWVYNSTLAEMQAQENSWDYLKNKANGKIATATVLDKDRNQVTHTIDFLSSQMKQSTLETMQESIIGLAQRRSKGHKAGGLKFKTEENSITLKQYGITYKIVGNKLKLQGYDKLFKIRGVDQIPADAEPASAKLVRRASGLYLLMTVFVPKVETRNGAAAGLDYNVGGDKQIVVSSGVAFGFKFKPTKKVLREQRKLSKKRIEIVKGELLYTDKKGYPHYAYKTSDKLKPRSNNWFKNRQMFLIEHENITNKKADVTNKIVSFLSEYSLIGQQDENIKAWQRGWSGKQINQMALGGIKAKTKSLPTTVVIDRFFPSTQLCSCCGKRNQIKLGEDIYECDCGLIINRDYNASINNRSEAIQKVPAEYRELTPTEIESSVKKVNTPYVWISFISQSQKWEASPLTAE
jgi:putative transposase